MAITTTQLKALRALIDSHEERSFYSWHSWKRVRREVMKMDKQECQRCKARGRYSKAVLVHHVHHLKDRPDLALSVYDEDGERNLVSLCKHCHELEHPESLKQYGWAVIKIPVTTERWD